MGALLSRIEASQTICQAGEKRMKTERKTKDELITELKSVSRRVKKLETMLEKREHTEEDTAEHNGAEELMNDSERRFRELIESLPQLFWTCRVDGPCDYLSKQWVAYTGVPEEEQLGYRWLEQLHPEDKDRIVSEWMEKVKTGESFDVEFRIRRSDGVYHWFKTRAVPMRDTEGHIAKWFGSNTEVDDLKRSLETQERLVSTIESSTDLISYADINANILYMNVAGRKLLGLNADDDITRYTIEQFISDDAKHDMFTVTLPEIFRVGGWKGDSAFKDIAGKKIPVALSCSLLKNRNGEPEYLAVNARDITERKRAEEALQESEERFRIAAETSNDVVYEWDLQQSVQWFGKIDEMLGYNPGEFPRTLDGLGASVHPEDWVRVMAAVQAHLEGRVPYAEEYRAIRKDGTFRWWSARGAVTRTPDGKPIRWVGTVTDITDRKKAEEEIKRLNDELEETVTQRTAQLKDALELNQKIISTSSLGIFACREEGPCIIANPAVAKISGASVDQMLKIDFRELDSWKKNGLFQKVETALQTQKEQRAEIHLTTNFGKDAWINYYITTFKSAGKLHFLMTVDDITKRKLAEIELERHRDHLQELIQERTTELVSSRELLAEAQTMAQLGSWKWDAVKDEITGSEEFYRLFGVGQEQIAHFQQFLSSLHTDDRERVQRDVADSLEQRKPYDTDYRVILSDGNVRYINARGQVFVDDGGKPLRMMGTCMDITVRKLADQELREREARYKTLVENIPQKILMKDRNYRWVSINENLARDFGFRPEEVVGKMDADLFLPELAAKYHSDDVRIMETGKTEELEEKYMVAGKESWVNTIKTPVRDANGEIMGVLGIFWDITERKRAEEEIRLLNTELEQRVSQRTSQLQAANKELEAFTYSVSHDLRAPLRHASGYVELLSKRCQSNLPENGQHYLSSIADSVRQMGVLIDDLLQFSRTGRMEMRQRDVDMNSIVQEIKESLRTDNPGRTIEWVLGALPSVSGDDAMLRLVWMNLLSNAIKFTRTRKKARIEIGVRKEAKEFVFFVHDDGVGFDMQYAQKLFGVFQRLHPTEEFEGTGIGLANVRRIILRHGGRTWAEGELDKGATFYFSIPK